MQAWAVLGFSLGSANPCSASDRHAVWRPLTFASAAPITAIFLSPKAKAVRFYGRGGNTRGPYYILIADLSGLAKFGMAIWFVMAELA